MARTPILDRFTRLLAAGNLFLTGEHTNSFYEWQGLIEGAALSGIQASQEILTPPLTPSTYYRKDDLGPRGSARGHPLLFSMRWVQRVASPRFRHELS
jgi:hypothetical protein